MRVAYTLRASKTTLATARAAGCHASNRSSTKLAYFKACVHPTWELNNGFAAAHVMLDYERHALKQCCFAFGDILDRSWRTWYQYERCRISVGMPARFKVDQMDVDAINRVVPEDA